MSQVIYIVGLGNPGVEYEGTRHNIGFEFVDGLASQLGLRWEKGQKTFHSCSGTFGHVKFRLIKPMTYMNRSGGPLIEAIRFYKDLKSSSFGTNLAVIHDELDFAPGIVRLKVGGGSGGHNGLKDITSSLGTDAYIRLRVGIGHPRDYVDKDVAVNIQFDVSNWVLGRMNRSEASVVEKRLSSIIEQMSKILSEEDSFELKSFIEKSIK